MTRKRRYRYNAVRCCMLLGLASIGFAACANSRGLRDRKQLASDDPTPAVMGTIPKAAEPSPEHQRLQALIGDWKAETRAWGRPGGPVEEGKGTLSNFWLLDGRFVGQEYKSRAQRPKYEGLGALGYDNIKKIYTSVWLDTAGTSIYNATGSCDASGKVFTLEGIDRDPVTGTPLRCRSTTHIINKKKYTFELFKEGSDGKMFRTLEVTYTRE